MSPSRPTRRDDAAPGDHEAFEELAAGYALDALEPEEETAFEEHLATCQECPLLLAELREVTGALAEEAPDVEPPAALGDRILRAAASTPVVSPSAGIPGDGLAVVVPMRRRPSRVAALRAAAVVVLVVGGVAGGLALSRGSTGSTGACAGSAGCQELALVSPVSSTVEARVLVHGVEVLMTPKSMAANDSAHTYVLWQLTKSQPPLAVGAFSYQGGSSTITIGTLPRAYPGTVAFAVSLEPGHAAPATPSKVIGVASV